MGNFRTTNLGVVIAESGLRPAESLLNNRSRRHALRLMSLPKGVQAKSLPGYGTAMVQRMVHFSEHSGRAEVIFLPKDGPTELDANISIADVEWVEQEARRADSQPGQVLWTDGLGTKMGRGGTRSCRRRDGAGPGGRLIWDSFRKHTTRSAPPLALAVAAERSERHKLGRVRIFTDAQAAIPRMTHDEPGPGQIYALQAAKAIAALHEREPSVEIEIRWYPTHKGIPGNEVVDGWAKQAASEPDDHGVEWLMLANGYRLPSRSTSLAHLKRRASEKWPEARSWCERRRLNKRYVLREKGKPESTLARAEKRTASRFYQLKSGHALTGRVPEEHG